jgi:hypothetical protein
MTVRTDEIVAIAQRGQEATTDAVRSWTELAQGYAANVTTENPLPTPADVHAAIDTWFTLAGRLLTEQHALATAVIDAGTEAASTVAEQARAAAAAVPAQPFGPATSAKRGAPTAG